MREWLQDHKIAVRVSALVAAVVAGLVWFFVGYKYDVWNQFVRSVTREFFVRQMFPSWNPLHWTPFTYLVLFVVFAGVAAVGRYTYEKTVKYGSAEYKRTTRTSKAAKVVVVAGMVFSLLSGVYATSGWWNNDKDEARSYADATKFVVEDPAKLPASLNPLIKGGNRTAAGSNCLFTTVHDVPSCVQQGTLPGTWDARKASLTGAAIVMNRTSGAVPNSDIMDETLTYLYGTGNDAVWSAIRNGSNKQPLNGIVTWDGSNSPQSCQFTGKYSLNYAFGGQWGQNLTDTLAKDYPGLLYDQNDMWGYCKGTGEITSREPVIVIPVTQQESYGRRTTLRSAGVLVIKGSSSGEPQITHQSSVKAGEYPGPVYPLTLVAKQRELLEWSAGRANKDRLHFGYEPADGTTQEGNSSEYLLRSPDGRLFWVTPLTPNSSESQLLVAYSITPADETNQGSLNEQRVYVLPDGDIRVVNLDDMEARVSEAIRTTNPGFFTGDKPGKITEFLPVDGKTWQAFAELNGRVVYRVEVPSDAKVRPTVQTLDSTVETPSGDKVCTKDKAQLTKAQLSDCIAQYAKELAGRN